MTVDRAHLGSGCSVPYSASLNSGGSSHNLGSRAWINPFTGAYPRGDSATQSDLPIPLHRILGRVRLVERAGEQIKVAPPRRTFLRVVFGGVEKLKFW